MAGTLFSPPRLRAVDVSGDPIPGARLYVYQAGTAVLALTYTSKMLAEVHANPQIANAAGEFSAIYLDPDAGYDYRFVCQTPTGVQLWVEDNVPAGIAGVDGGGTGGGGTTGTPGLSVAEIKIYQRASVAPPTPTGGSFNFSTQSLSAPEGWSATIPDGSEPLYVSTAVAAVEGATGIDSILQWSAPVKMAQDGSSVDIIFKRSATQPATPAPSPSTPVDWYTDVNSVPVSTDKLWSSVGTRDNASQNWVWQLPIQVEGDRGLPGVDSTLYYIKPTQGTAIKNGTGTLTVEARKVFGGNDVLLNSGAIQLYAGTTLITAGNGFVAGSNGYTGVFDSGDISGSLLVELKDGPTGNVYDTITLVDVLDGSADTGKNAVYGYVEASNGLAWVRGSDQTTWTPSGTTTRLDVTFVQNAADVARIGWLITRNSSGILTGAVTTHGGAGDLNTGRVTVTQINEGSQALTVQFAYSYLGDTTTVTETILTSLAGSKGDPGDTGTPGVDGDPGLSIAELAIYIRASSPPATPTGGSYDFDTFTLTAPSGWSSEIPSGYEPVYASRTVAAISGETGTDDDLTWATPVLVLENGASIDIIFRRSAAQPSTPPESSGVPAGWYSDVASVPASSDPLWSSVGSRANAAENWVWQTPIRVEGEKGDPGDDGADAVLYYIKALSGTAIKNGSGTLTVEAHRVTGGTDVLLSTGTIKLYVGTTEVTVANGYAAGSNGYTGVFDSGDISGSTVVTLKDGSGGTPLDTITLVDVVDGAVGGVGTDAVYGYIETDQPLAWVRAPDQTTWTPSDPTLQMNATFVQGGAEVARTAYVITRASNGTLTGASGTHPSGNLNGSRVTVSELGGGTQVITVKFAYSYSGDETAVSETALTSLSGTNGTGTPGTPATSLTLTNRAILLFAYQNGSVVSYAPANGLATVWSGTTNVTSSAGVTFTISASSNVSGATINSAVNTPISGKPKGYYQITGLNADTGSITISATYNGQTLSEVVSFSKNYVGYEIVGSLPSSGNLFQGRIVFLTTDSKLYRYTGSSWTRAVDGADIQANSVTTDAMFAGTITTAKLRVTDLSVLSSNMGTLTSGTIALVNSGHIRAGQTTYNSGSGFWLGFDGGTPKFSIGNPATQYLRWTGTGLEFKGTLAAEIVDSSALALGSVTSSFLYSVSGSFIGDVSAPGVGWYDMTQPGLDARVTVTGIPVSGGRVVVEMNLNVGSNGAADLVRYRMMRNDNVVITPSYVQVYLRETAGQIISWNFIDSSPTSATHTYRLQHSRVSGNAGILFDVQLLATLFKR